MSCPWHGGHSLRHESGSDDSHKVGDSSWPPSLQGQAWPENRGAASPHIHRPRSCLMRLLEKRHGHAGEVVP